MDAGVREIAEGTLYQGVDEQIVYTLTTTNWGSSPSGVSVKAYDAAAPDTDISSTVLSGSPSTAGDVITLPTVKALSEGHRYRIEIQFTIAGAATPFEAYAIIVGQR